MNDLNDVLWWVGIVTWIAGHPNVACALLALAYCSIEFEEKSNG